MEVEDQEPLWFGLLEDMERDREKNNMKNYVFGFILCAMLTSQSHGGDISVTSLMVERIELLIVNTCDDGGPLRLSKGGNG